MKIQETLIALVFGAMIIAAILAGQKPDERYFPLREWAGKADFQLDFSGEIWVEPKTGIELIRVDGGCFEMGCIEKDWQCNPNEYPAHKVCLDGFWLGRYPVTQKQWLRIFKTNPSQFQTDENYPVERVSWHDVRKYIDELNVRQGKEIFRLPTEAEWEYACREKGNFGIYSGSMDAEEVAWHRGNSGGSTRPVGSRMPNRLGLYDMSGNVFEWVQDVYDENAYNRHRLHNPLMDTGLGPAYNHYLTLIEPYIGGDSRRVIRGGSWRHQPTDSRCSGRHSMVASGNRNDLGFRIARNRPDY